MSNIEQHIYCYNINGATYIRGMKTKLSTLKNKIINEYHDCPFKIFAVYSYPHAMKDILDWIHSKKTKDRVTLYTAKILSMDFETIWKKCKEICERPKHDPDRDHSEDDGSESDSDHSDNGGYDSSDSFIAPEDDPQSNNINNHYDFDISDSDTTLMYQTNNNNDDDNDPELIRSKNKKRKIVDDIDEKHSNNNDNKKSKAKLNILPIKKRYMDNKWQILVVIEDSISTMEQITSYMEEGYRYKSWKEFEVDDNNEQLYIVIWKDSWIAKDKISITEQRFRELELEIIVSINKNSSSSNNNIRITRTSKKKQHIHS